ARGAPQGQGCRLLRAQEGRPAPARRLEEERQGGRQDDEGSRGLWLL
ncbi:hypothetical protein BN1708_018556, partial [Verticillium longisporum]